MTTTSITRNADGEVTETLESTPTATIGFARKVTFPDTYGAYEEASIFVQVPLTDDDPQGQIESAYAKAKATVFGQLGLASEVQPNGVVASPAQVGTPSTSKGKGGSKPKSSGGSSGGSSNGYVEMTDDLKAQCWADLASANVEDKGKYLSITCQDGETVYDNRESKRSANGPDFKWKDSGYALWLKDAPDWFDGPGKGL